MRLSALRARLKPWIRREKPLLVALFGSTVRGLPGPEPDVDIAVLFGREVEPGRVITDLQGAMGSDDVDLMILDHADPIARMSASAGELVHEDRPGRWLEFQSLAARQFMDHGKFFRARRELIDRFLDAGTRT